MSFEPEPTRPPAGDTAHPAHTNGAAPLVPRAAMLPVAAPGGQLVQPRRLPSWLLAPAAPVARVAAAAGGGFLAGVALMGLLHRRRRRSALAAARRRRRPLSRAQAGGRGPQAAGRGREVVHVVGSRSLLVDVHLLGDR
jgi:hypothetical protein